MKMNTWLIQTENGGTIQAFFLVSGSGILRQPFIPKLYGLANFRRIVFKVFHSYLYLRFRGPFLLSLQEYRNVSSAVFIRECKNVMLLWLV